MLNEMEQNFKLIRREIDVRPFQEELQSFLEHAGSWSSIRSQEIPVQRNTKNIELRGAVLPKEKLEGLGKLEKVMLLADVEDHELRAATYPYFQKTYAFIESFADSIGGQLTRAMIVTLAPETQVYPHEDVGLYYKTKDRYHIPIRTKGSLNKCGDEYQVYQEGELWWFDNKKTHEAFNNSNEERIHIIFDILPKERSLIHRLKDYFEKKVCLLRNGVDISTIN